jgi:hypothetical protein
MLQVSNDGYLDVSSFLMLSIWRKSDQAIWSVQTKDVSRKKWLLKPWVMLFFMTLHGFSDVELLEVNTHQKYKRTSIDAHAHNQAGPTAIKLGSKQNKTYLR